MIMLALYSVFNSKLDIAGYV